MTTPPHRSPQIRGRSCAGLRALAPNIHEFRPVPAAAVAVPALPDPSSISPDAWWHLEGATFSVMHKIQPTVSSQQLRARVIDYLQRLFRLHDYQVISFGSVPFRTCLPDGDIDLTLFGTAISDKNLENEVCVILKSEGQRKDSEFEVKDVKYVPANKVKLVKCKVQNIAVDISVNQIGGPNKLYFFEKIDQNLGKDNLLRRSIILIKHWCNYESCILGAQRGLISTYALEILVLYIFHIFHKSLDGPLAVLYCFLDYYSKFDWDNKGISLFGPISLSSLPELVTEPPNTRDDGFLPREEFIKDCAKAFSIPPINSEKNPQVFSKKFVNIVDPLKQNNNLGCSVSKANFDRICREFYNGAYKLGKILQAPAGFSVNEINRFFRNTLKTADVLASSPDNVLLTANFTNDSVLPCSDVERINRDSSPNNSCDVLCNQLSYMKISDSNHHDSMEQKECNSVADYNEIKSASWGVPDSDATSDATTDSVSIRNGGVFSDASPSPSESRCDFSDASQSPSESCTFQSGRDRCAQHLFFQSENSKKFNVIDGTIPSHREMSAVRFVGRSGHSFEDARHIKEYSGRPPSLPGYNAYTSATGLVDVIAPSNLVLTPKISQRGGSTNNIVSNLTGGFGINFHNNLLCAQRFQQDNSNQLYYYPMLANNGAVSAPLRHQTNYHIPMRAHGTGAYIPDSNLLVGRPPAVHANTLANDHGTTATAAAAAWRPASSSPCSARRHPPASMPPPSPPLPVAWPVEAQAGAQYARDVTGGGGLVGIRGGAGVGAEGPAAPVASAHSKARMRRPRTRGRR